MRYLIALLALAGCTNYSKLSSGAPDLAGPAQFDDFAGVDFAGEDLAGVDFKLPPPGDMATSNDMPKTADMTQTTDMAAPCIGSLANIKTANFAIRFKITTTAQVASTVMYQRSDCNLPTSDYWELTMAAVTGTLGISSGNGNPSTGPSHQSSLDTTIAVNDGNPHEVLFTRVSGVLSATTDGAASGGGVPTPVSFGALPPLGIASGDPCGAATLVGTITNVCLQTF